MLPDSDNSCCLEMFGVPLVTAGVLTYCEPIIGGAERGLSTLSSLTRLLKSLLAEAVPGISFRDVGCFDLRRESPLCGKFGICVVTGDECVVDDSPLPFSVVLSS